MYELQNFYLYTFLFIYYFSSLPVIAVFISEFWLFDFIDYNFEQENLKSKYFHEMEMKKSRKSNE